MKKLSTKISLLIIGLIIGGSVALFFQGAEQVKGVWYKAIDVVGTRVGTTTTPVGFSITSTGGQSATSTYITSISEYTESAIYTFYVAAASSTANLDFSILTSNDYNCNTASTTGGTLNPVLMSDINWFDAIPFLLNGASTQSFAVATSSIHFDTSSGATKGRQVLLTDIHAQCLRLDLSGSSTKVWVQLKTKDRN